MTGEPEFRVARSRTPLIGPLAGWELMRLARRGQGHRARLMVAYLLLIAFILSPVLWFPDVDTIVLFTGPSQKLPRKEAAQFGQRFALVLLEAVLFAVAAMTPGYAAIAIADEKERQTLPLLLTTCLSDREIVLGKAVGRFVFVLIAAMAALPVLFVTRLFGGVGVQFLLAGMGLIAGTAILSTAIGVDAACATKDLRSALVRAYGVTAFVVGTGVIPPFVLISPFGVLMWLEDPGWHPAVPAIVGGVAYPFLQFLVAIGFFASAIRRLRREEQLLPPVPRPRLSLGDAPKKAEPELELEDDTEHQDEATEPKRRGELPRVDEVNPLLWKERFVENRRLRSDGATLVQWALAGLAVLLLVIGSVNLVGRIWADKYEEDEGGRLVMSGGTILGGVYLFPAAMGLASCVARERRRNTLESLLAIPFDRRVLLRTKVRAVLERGWWWAPVSVLATGVAFGADGGWRLGLLAGGLTLTGAWFAISLGAYLTVRSVSEVRAFRFLVPAVVVVVGAPVALWNSTDWTGPFLSELTMGAGAMAFAIAGTLLWRRAGRALDRLA